MGFFNWAAPLFGHFADRWDDAGIEQIAGWLSPFLGKSCAGTCRILDVGGGTGALARRLRETLGAEVTVLDPTPEMLRYLPEDPLISGVVGVAEKMPFADDSFDAVIVTDAFHHFRDQPGAVREFCRVVHPGGGVVVVELDPRSLPIRVIVPIERLLGEPGAFFSPDAMCSFMSAHGIDGACAAYSRISYRFIGEVVKRDPAARHAFQR